MKETPASRFEQASELRAWANVFERLIELGRLLHDHVRLEEDHIFPRIEKVLGESEFDAIDSRLTRLHGKKQSAI